MSDYDQRAAKQLALFARAYVLSHGDPPSSVPIGSLREREVRATKLRVRIDRWMIVLRTNDMLLIQTGGAGTCVLSATRRGSICHFDVMHKKVLDLLPRLKQLMILDTIANV